MFIKEKGHWKIKIPNCKTYHKAAVYAVSCVWKRHKRSTNKSTEPSLGHEKLTYVKNLLFMKM